MKKIIFSFFISSFLISVMTSYALAGFISPELQSVLQSLKEQDEVSVIIILSDRVEPTVFKSMQKNLLRSKIINALREKADQTLKPVKTFLEMRKVRKIKPLWIINGIAATARADVIREISALPEVEVIKLDATIQTPSVTYGSSTLPEWNIELIHAPELWNMGYRGSGTVIASMDTGVDLHHPDLMNKWRGGSNSWYDPHGVYNTPYDRSGHGTQTMGIVVGGDAGGTAIGVAPDAQWIAVKIFNDSGKTSLSAIHQGFQWILDPDGNPDTDDAPDIVYNSWGLNNINGCSLEFQSDIHTLRAANIAVIFSAGNSGPASLTSVSPANNSESYSVGAIDSSLQIASFSSRGPSACNGNIYPEVVAPGVNIKTSDLTAGGLFPDSYAVVSGTSFSSAHVAGAMALLLDAFPDLTVSELDSALEQSAFDLGTTGMDNEYGYGLIDVVEAYNVLYNYLQDISVSPVSYDFGITRIGTNSASKIFVITNKGEKNLVIGRISIMGQNSSQFKKLSDYCSGRTLEPSTTCNIEVVFSPLSEARKRAVLSIPSNDPDTPIFNIPLYGIGVQIIYPKVTVIVPNGGEVIPSGSNYLIQWGAPESTVRFRLFYSLDNRATWNLIANNVRNIRYKWNVPALSESKYGCLIRIIGYDGSNKKVGEDRSDAPFTIEVQASSSKQ